MIIKWILPMFLLVSLAQGHNNAFLPGDAFFSTSLTEEELAKFSDWRSSDPLPRYVYQINVTSESARYREFGDDGWEEFLIGGDGQLLPVLKPTDKAAEDQKGGE